LFDGRCIGGRKQRGVTVFECECLGALVPPFFCAFAHMKLNRRFSSHPT
jgi:hypothetical protein